jgi:hypothetical protein
MPKNFSQLCKVCRQMPTYAVNIEKNITAYFDNKAVAKFDKSVAA